MITEGLLLAVAQIAVALIGFSGIVTALGARGQGRWTNAELLQLKTLVEPSVVVLILAFVPFALKLVYLPEDLVWRTASGIAFGLHIFAHIMFLRRGSTGDIRLSHKLMQGVCLVVYVVLLVSVLDLFEYHQLAFLFGLLLGMFISVHNFYLLLFTQES